jgi:hypothetical protein
MPKLLDAFGGTGRNTALISHIEFSDDYYLNLENRKKYVEKSS